MTTTLVVFLHGVRVGAVPVTPPELTDQVSALTGAVEPVDDAWIAARLAALALPELTRRLLAPVAGLCRRTRDQLTT